MAKRKDIKKVLIIGSGPIVIGQAAEFDYAGTQACLALKEEGYEVILCNSNPATIMTDTTIADKVYMEPLTLEYIAKILRFERPDAIVPGIGGQTGLNLAMQLEKKGVLKECGVELLGTSSESIERAEDRELFDQILKQTEIPRALHQEGFNYLGSDRFIEDGSMIRLNYVQISYSLDPKLTKKIGMQSVSMNLSMNNVFLLTKYSGSDPEISTGGYGLAQDNSQTPRSKSFTANINIGF